MVKPGRNRASCARAKLHRHVICHVQGCIANNRRTKRARIMQSIFVFQAPENSRISRAKATWPGPLGAAAMGCSGANSQAS